MQDTTINPISRVLLGSICFQIVFGISIIQKDGCNIFGARSASGESIQKTQAAVLHRGREILDREFKA